MASVLNQLLWMGWLFSAFVCLPLDARDLGVCGHLFPIEEQDMLEMLRTKMRSLSQEELMIVQKKVQQHYLSCIRSPREIGLKEAKTYRRYDMDPTLCAQQEIKDHMGNVIVPIGKCINPLEMNLSLNDLLFFDGSNSQQIEWAKTENPQAKWILIKGKPLDLEEQEQRPVYFDQSGVLTGKFGIQHVPAKISKEGLKLKIEEIPIGG